MRLSTFCGLRRDQEQLGQCQKKWRHRDQKKEDDSKVVKKNFFLNVLYPE